ncbi:MAG: translation initiation factor IF-2 [Candidatus Scalindua rubra]|uniref:Translation initiation factor IF-2 n=1 Tax=Candidatus Scalindua brodae TaxID=237368 RepID=A0A0B0EII3_9BACT|nr:MAG: translation initiation factor IF-2 [Candidatus Scalindua brodae]MBZ0109817.1 translation initiation factor IF-2 [Candidatus Scalindua rubra]TWU35433.1 Translation initiation factor IF-2 [Candidatus Brocadiaceae bacterium S225]
MVRINKLAKDLGFKNSFLIEKCQEYGFVDIKHHANALTDEQASLLRSKLVSGAKQSVSVKEKSGTPVVKKVGTEKKAAGAAKVVSKGSDATTVRRRIPLWKQKAREDLIKGRWKEVTKVSQQKRPRRFEKRTKEVPDEQAVAPPKEKESKVTVELPATIKDVSAALGVKAGDIISKLLIGHNIFATINQGLDGELIEMLGIEYGVEIELKQAKEDEDEFSLEEVDDQEEDLKARAPIVTFLGHVDHGKTSLLDSIRKTNVVSFEAGGITQHIGAYRVETNGKSVVFLDTPGHEAFTAMRARGANVTDLVVLVVAADDGVMPQTEEAINHARAADVPIVVAINKVDKPGANVQKVKQQLASLELNPEEWGGKVQMIETSVVTKAGLDTLLDGLLLEAEILELKAVSKKPARGIVLEAHVHEGRGIIANLLVREGTLKHGDIVLCGQTYGRVRAIYNDHGKEIKVAGPSTPVAISGLSTCPEAGDKFYSIKDIQKAREIASKRERKMREVALSDRQHVTLDNLYKKIEEGQVKEIKVIIKADFKGSAEVLKKSLEEISTKEVRTRILHSGVGGITETDILLADASDAIVIGFHVVPEDKAKILAESCGVDVRLYKIIYDATNDIKAALEGLLEPDKIEQVLGSVEVRKLFKVSKIGNIAGCYVKSGKILRNSHIRLIRDSVVLFDGKIATLRVVKDDAKEVRAGFECGLRIAGFDDIKVGDVIESYEIQHIARRLE